MRTVLLAVEGTIPEREILGCAVGLCRRMRAELRVLHILDPGLWKSHGKRLAKQISRGRTLLEASMAAAAFAEAGEPDMALELLEQSCGRIREALAAHGADGMNCRLLIAFGEAHGEIRRLVRHHRDIVLAVYAGPAPAVLQQKICVPLVIARRRDFPQRNPKTRKEREI